MSAMSKSLARLGDRHSPALTPGGRESGGQPVMGYMGMLPHQAERIDRGATWSDPEVEELLNIWTNQNVQAELKEATIKKHIFERIARSLREAGFFRTAEQCREKIKRLKKEYRQAKNNNYRCVRGRATVKFFPRLQAVMEHNQDLLRPALKMFYNEPPDYGPADSPSPYALVIKESPRSLSDCSAEEISVKINPDELDKDMYMRGGGSSDVEPGEPDVDEPMPPTDLSQPLNLNSHHREPSPPSPPAPQRLQHSHHPRQLGYSHLAHPLDAAVHRPISIGIPFTFNNHHGSFVNHDNSRHTAHTGSNNSTPNGLSLTTKKVNGVGSNGVWPSPAKDDSDASSSCSRPNTPLSPSRDRSPMSSSRKRKGKRGRSFRSSELRKTLDLTLTRLLQHQTRTEDRLIAWEERRIKAEMEVEERWRQEDRELLQQIVAQLAGVKPANGVSEPSPAASSSSPSNSLHEH